MNYIILTKQEAEQIAGFYGKPRGMDNTYPAKIEPTKTPDGMFIISEACLTSELFKEAHEKIQKTIRHDNIQEIKMLPKAGERAEAGRYYIYQSDKEDDPVNGIVKCIKDSVIKEKIEKDRTVFLTFAPIEEPVIEVVQKSNILIRFWLKIKGLIKRLL